MTATKITENGKYLARCGQCGAWVEVHPETVPGDLFFETLKAEFLCCGRQQAAFFTREKDCLDFH